MRQERVVLVLGGSAGIGLAIAKKFAAHGAGVVLVARDATRLADAAERVRRVGPVDVWTLAVDATAADAPARIARFLDEEGIALGHVVVGLGAWHSGAASALEPDALKSIVDVNVIAHHALQRTLVPRLPKGGGILFIGSLAGYLPLPWLGAYAASKAHLRASVMALRAELAGTGVRVSLLAPGPVATGFVPQSAGAGWRAVFDLVASSPTTVANAAYGGLLAGTPVIVPGLLSRIIWFGVRVLPASIVERMARRAMRGLNGAEARVGAGVAGVLPPATTMGAR